MAEYIAPLNDMKFAIEDLGGLEELTALSAFEDATPELVDAVLEEANRLASDVLSPLNYVGDREGATLEGNVVRTPAGWGDAYRMFVEGGWNGLACAPEFGGQGLPKLVATAVNEMWSSANVAFSLCPLLTSGAIEAIETHGTDDDKARYLHKMVSGEWTGTMNLTEPQAGSDLSAVRTKAVPQDNHYLVSGQKIYITYGEHDLAENIIHLVLARLPDAPEGTRGISLFIVPKFLVNDDGSLGERNDVNCVSIEHKLGIHASPTCVMSYGENGGAVGYLVGEPHKGLVYMFTMMNNARHGVGLEGVALAERAYQKALEYARDRIQGTPTGSNGGERATIIEHPDVRRMLMTMKATTEAMRAVAYVCATAYDLGAYLPDQERRAFFERRGDFLTPIVKGWSTEKSIELASIGIQVHGGMGYVEETGAAQYLRDARITTIYEGTTGIQAADLVGRKTLRDGGHAARELLAEIEAECAALEQSGDPRLGALKPRLEAAVADAAAVLEWLVGAQSEDPRLPAAASCHYLNLWGVLCGGWQMARAARIAVKKISAGESSPFLDGKLASASFFTSHVLPQTAALRASIIDGSAATLELAAANF